MFERFTRNTVVASGAALLAALGVGTAAIAQSNGSQPTKSQSSQSQAKEVPGQESGAPENSATDKDNVQYTAPGDPDYKGASASRAQTTAASSAQPEQPGTEQPAASEQPGTESSSETAPDSDGPGGHADEPGNANANHQFQGAE